MEMDDMDFFFPTCAQYASMNEFTCSENSVRIRRSKKRSTGNQPLRCIHVFNYTISVKKE